MLPAMTPVSLKIKNKFLRGKVECMIGVQVISNLLPDFFAFRCSRSCFKTIWFCYKNFPYPIAELKVNKNKIIKVNK